MANALHGYCLLSRGVYCVRCATTIPSGPPVCLCLCPAYGATKKYLDNLSVSLNAEYAPFGVRVQNQWAGSVATKMPGIK